MPSPLDHGENWILMESKRTSDGMGGYTYAWTEGVEFTGLATLDSSIEAIVAEKSNEYIRLHLQVEKNVPLKLDDYIKRKVDGSTYQVKSDPNINATPNDASLDFKEFDLIAAPLPTK